MKRHYGFIKQKVDSRDLLFRETVTMLPPSIDLRGLNPPIYDQGQLGSCTANGIARLVEFDFMKQKLPIIMPSRLFIYYNERAMEGTISQDSGANIRDGIKTINTLGVCDERLWAYNIAKFKQKPPAICYTDALLTKSIKYMVVTQDLNSIKSALVLGYPVVIGFEVKTSFESATVAKTGIYTPKANEKIIGGHCVVIVGYDDSTQRFIIANSWGIDWGQLGYFTMPYSEVLNTSISSDFWVIETVL
jgi:C1A family cysteine protease